MIHNNSYITIDNDLIQPICLTYFFCSFSCHFARNSNHIHSPFDKHCKQTNKVHIFFINFITNKQSAHFFLSYKDFTYNILERKDRVKTFEFWNMYLKGMGYKECFIKIQRPLNSRDRETFSSYPNTGW